ncbi:hypothetical protein HRM2_19920 [Desulforapulum autotrophicum HRM2]|uniref:Alpha-L-glutamate ligase-related protein ATP-grasp domain-containing protein n=1 Tax=Desulforapulum autotrophicum (strain ATCC 43914 / DSM 3382 / VKM B-1955 / HRM2) TaxID=177437 RepID=C0QCL6_DESAH|nr:sugar-transfer associated ATP-grasp domain-containing protein [Desulforapulum autotrophicum]ACN15093.1 hypothetical protein HRM2_19920 [Desulforapulum autotrophicum HRM2]
MNYLKKSIQGTTNTMWQYRKAFSAHCKGSMSLALSTMPKILKAHFKFGISPLLYSFFQFDNVPESEWSEYTTNQEKFTKLLVGNSTVEARRTAGNKLQFYNHCIKKGLPIIPVFCAVSNDQNLNIDGVEIINDIEKWRKIISTLPKELFVKPFLGRSGIGAFAVYRENGNFNFAGCNGSAEDLFEYIKVRVKPGKGFIVQPRMKTHSSLRAIVSQKGLSTIRVTTIRRNGKTEIIMACLKIIRGKNEHDNFSKGMSNNLIAAINTETGELAPAWGSTASDWPIMTQYAIHPDTGEGIEGFVLPSWNKIVELAVRAQDSLPLLQTIGWDMALTDEGEFIVEANTAYDPVLFQLLQQRGLKRGALGVS